MSICLDFSFALYTVLVLQCNVSHFPIGGSTVPLEYEAGCVCEARARESHQPCEHGQCEDWLGEHSGYTFLHDLKANIYKSAAGCEYHKGNLLN